MQDLPTISRFQLKKRSDSKRPFILVEALTADQFTACHLPGAINLPRYQMEELAPRLVPDQNAEIVVYSAGPWCQIAFHAAQLLVEMGYTNVRYYPGGKEDWAEAGLPLVGERPAVRRDVAAYRRSTERDVA
ncbi:MAG TPA: rhodanese-like domain-containing protein [Terriglobales bacterium]|nr:rhodanese-like domain-containing protein [Terriglobales bacterium]